MKDAAYYLKILIENPHTLIDVAVAASAVYAARFGICETEHGSTDEWKNILLDLKTKYGESLTSAGAFVEMTEHFVRDHERNC